MIVSSQGQTDRSSDPFSFGVRVHPVFLEDDAFHSREFLPMPCGPSVGTIPALITPARSHRPYSTPRREARRLRRGVVTSARSGGPRGGKKGDAPRRAARLWSTLRVLRRATRSSHGHARSRGTVGPRRSVRSGQPCHGLWSLYSAQVRYAPVRLLREPSVGGGEFCALRPGGASRPQAWGTASGELGLRAGGSDGGVIWMCHQCSRSIRSAVTVRPRPRRP